MLADRRYITPRIATEPSGSIAGSTTERAECAGLLEAVLKLRLDTGVDQQLQSVSGRDNFSLVVREINTILSV